MFIFILKDVDFNLIGEFLKNYVLELEICRVYDLCIECGLRLVYFGIFVLKFVF